MKKAVIGTVDNASSADGVVKQLLGAGFQGKDISVLYPDPRGEDRIVTKDVDTGKGIPGVVFDMWQASTNGKYDVFDPENQTRHNLRGKFRTDENGRFWFYCLKPTEYAIDTSGPSADLLKIMGRHPMRPAHIHIMVTHPDYLGVTAQLYPDDDPYIETDTTCAVKDDLLLHFTPVTDEKEGATLDVEYDIRLASKKYKPDYSMLMENANQNNFEH